MNGCLPHYETTVTVNYQEYRFHLTLDDQIITFELEEIGHQEMYLVCLTNQQIQKYTERYSCAMNINYLYSLCVDSLSTKRSYPRPRFTQEPEAICFDILFHFPADSTTRQEIGFVLKRIQQTPTEKLHRMILELRRNQSDLQKTVRDLQAQLAVREKK